ncbi:MAG: NRDE family protein [Lysobacter sp.]|nr:MAG: NRDE family protein [Lysobacter sp.]
MCLIALAWRTHPRYRLVLAANRDEFHARPTLPLDAWRDDPGVIGGRDALHGGGWLALRGRRLAAVTNVRRPGDDTGRTRGALVAEFVRGGSDADPLAAIARDAMTFRPFNLLAYDGRTLSFATNRAEPRGEARFARHAFEPGVHGVSNGALDAPWPKTRALTARLAAWSAIAASRPDDATNDATDHAPDLAPLFAALGDTAIAPDASLPDTGIDLELERFLSPAFIRGERYGTRASTVVLIADDHARIVERRFGPEGVFEGETDLRVAFEDVTFESVAFEDVAFESLPFEGAPIEGAPLDDVAPERQSQRAEPME